MKKLSAVLLPAAQVATGLVRLPVAFLFLRFLVQKKEKPAPDVAGYQ